MRSDSMRWLWLVLALALVAPVARAQMGGMGGMGSPPPAPKGSGEDLIPDIDPSVAKDPNKSFARGEQEFKEHNWLDAIAYYRHVMQTFAYDVPLAAKAELRLGDVAFEREKYGQARGYYKNFVRFHPGNPQADYAAYRVGLSAFKEIPGDLFFEPPSIEKDQTEVLDALAASRDFVQRFPTSQYVPEAKKVIAKCDEKLAGHELYVARFYQSRGKWKGVVLRADGLVRRYPESKLAPEALYLLTRAHLKLHDKPAAQRDVAQLAQLAPKAKWTKKAQEALAKAR